MFVFRVALNRSGGKVVVSRPIKDIWPLRLRREVDFHSLSLPEQAKYETSFSVGLSDLARSSQRSPFYRS